MYANPYQIHSKISECQFAPTQAATHSADRCTHTTDPDYGGVRVRPMTCRRFPAKLHTKCLLIHIPPLSTVPNSLSCTKTGQNARNSIEILENDPQSLKKGRQTRKNGFATGGDGFSRGGDGFTRGGDGFTTARQHFPTGGDGFLPTKHAFSPSAPVAPALPARGLRGDGFPTGGDGFSHRPTESDDFRRKS